MVRDPTQLCACPLRSQLPLRTLTIVFLFLFKSYENFRPLPTKIGPIPVLSSWLGLCICHYFIHLTSPYTLSADRAWICILEAADFKTWKSRTTNIASPSFILAKAEFAHILLWHIWKVCLCSQRLQSSSCRSVRSLATLVSGWNQGLRRTRCGY